MREFGLDFETVLDLPLKRFWFLVNQIDRLRAEQDLRQLQILGSVESQESARLAVEALSNEIGQVYVWDEPAHEEIRIDPETGLDPEFDKAGLQRLRSLAQLKMGDPM